jgi:NADH-ubiquinone oxidoreductase chain 6
MINLLTFGILFSSIISITSNNPVISIIFLISAFVNAAGYLILLGINFIGISYIVIYVGAIAVLFLFIILMINIKLTDILDTGYNYTKNLPMGLNIASLLLFLLFTLNSPLFNANIFNPINNIENLFSLFSLWPNAVQTAGFSPASLGGAVRKHPCPAFGRAEGAEASGITQIRDNLLTQGEIDNTSIFLEKGGIIDINLLEFTQIEVLGHFLYTYGSIFIIILSLILLLAMLAIIIISKKNINNI